MKATAKIVELQLGFPSCYAHEHRPLFFLSFSFFRLPAFNCLFVTEWSKLLWLWRVVGFFGGQFLRFLWLFTLFLTA